MFNCSLVFTRISILAEALPKTATTMASVERIVDLSGQTEQSPVALQQQPCLADLPAEKVPDTESCLKDRHPTSIPPREAGKAFIPDMFVSFISQKPTPNPYYEVVKPEYESWMKQ